MKRVESEQRWDEGKMSWKMKTFNGQKSEKCVKKESVPFSLISRLTIIKTDISIN